MKSKQTERWKIYWNDYMSDGYVYGNNVSFEPGNVVRIENELISAGTVLKTWYSKTNYQSQRIEPSLPIIDGEVSYHLSLDIDSDIDNGIIVRLSFYDRYDIKIGEMLIRDKETDFKCPLATYSYRMELIAGGARRIIYRNVAIQEIADETYNDSEQTEQNTEEN